LSKISEKAKAEAFFTAKAGSEAMKSKSNLQSQNAIARSASQCHNIKTKGLCFNPYTNS